jgi:hypothetical protein
MRNLFPPMLNTVMSPTNDADPNIAFSFSWIGPGGGFDQVHPMPQRLAGTGFLFNELSNPFRYDPHGLGG